MKTADAGRNPQRPEEYTYGLGYAPGSGRNGETLKKQWFGYGAGDGYKSNNYQATVIPDLGGSGGSNRTTCQTYTVVHPDGQMDGCGWSAGGAHQNGSGSSGCNR